jgi:hypothetical protein
MRYVSICMLLFAVIQPVGSAHGLLIKMTDEELVENATVICTGRVSSVKSDYNYDQSLIYTYVSIEVKTVLKGHIPEHTGNRVNLRIPGGLVGDNWLHVTDMPYFRESEEVVLFLNPENVYYFTPVGCYQGKLTVEHDRIIERNGESVTRFLRKLNKLIAECSDIPISPKSE